MKCDGMVLQVPVKVVQPNSKLLNKGVESINFSLSMNIHTKIYTQLTNTAKFPNRVALLARNCYLRRSKSQ